VREHSFEMLNRWADRLRPIPTNTIQNLIAICDSDSDLHAVRDVVRIVANTGLMSCELLSLRLSDVNEGGRSIAVGQTRSRQTAIRVLPVRQKTLESIFSVHRIQPESPLILGEAPKEEFMKVKQSLRTRFPELARRRRLMDAIRTNFLHRLILAGLPRSVVRYWLGHQDLRHMMAPLGLTDVQKLEIVRRNIDHFMIEL
jgi:integrase